MFGRFAHQRHRRDTNFLNIRRGAANFDLRDAGDHGRRPYGDEHRIRTRRSFQENIGGTDVGVGAERMAASERE